MTTYTRPRSIPARCLRRGDEMAFGLGHYDGPLTEPDYATDDRTRWFRITGIRAGSSTEPMAVEFGGYDHEFDLDDPVVIREAT